MFYDLKEAQVPEFFLTNVEMALNIFWDSFNNEFKEVTTGDSQMCDEPANTIALWIGKTAGVDLPNIKGCDFSLSIPANCSEKRVDKTLNNAISQMMKYLKHDFPNINKPTQEDYDRMRAVYCDVLHWNFPEKKTTKKKM